MASKRFVGIVFVGLALAFGPGLVTGTVAHARAQALPGDAYCWMEPERDENGRWQNSVMLSRARGVPFSFWQRVFRARKDPFDRSPPWFGVVLPDTLSDEALSSGEVWIWSYRGLSFVPSSIPLSGWPVPSRRCAELLSEDEA